MKLSLYEAKFTGFCELLFNMFWETEPWGPFSKAPIINGPVKLLFVYNWKLELSS